MSRTKSINGGAHHSVCLVSAAYDYRKSWPVWIPTPRRSESAPDPPFFGWVPWGALSFKEPPQSRDQHEHYLSNI